MKGRGIDFKHRFNTSRWAEDLLIASLGLNHGLLTARFGLSEVKPDNELVYGNSPYKEPDLLVYRLKDLAKEEIALLRKPDALVEMDRSRFGNRGDLKFVLNKALAALEVEFSPYKASEMRQRNWKPKTAEQWQKRPLKHANPPMAPNIWVKEEDLAKLVAWETNHRTPILVVHVFNQEGFAIRLREIALFDERYMNAGSDEKQRMSQVTGGIFKKIQNYDRTDAQAAGEKKTVFVVSPAVATKIGDISGVKVKAQLDISASKKYVSHVLFKGGSLKVSNELLELLARMRD